MTTDCLNVSREGKFAAPRGGRCRGSLCNAMRVAVLLLASVAAAGAAPSGQSGTDSSAIVSTAPPTKNPLVAIEYVEPKSAQLREVYQRLEKLQVLQMLQEFLAPLKLPQKLVVKTDECNALQLAYKSGQPVTICYELIRAIEVNAPGANAVRVGSYVMTKESIVAGGIISVLLNQVAYAVFDMFKIPVWGRQEDAADYVAALVMLEFPKDAELIKASLVGTSWYLAQLGFAGLGDFRDVVRSSEAQRFYNYACMAYGAYPGGFAFLVENGNLPKDRANDCSTDYNKLRHAFRQTVMPHVDQEMLKRVRAFDWAARLHLTSK